MKTIDNYDFKGKRALIRVDFNVPLNDQHEVTDDTRIRSAIPTIERVLDKGGAVVLMSHLGRPKGEEEKYSLRHVKPKLEELLGRNILFANDCIGAETEKITGNLEPGAVVLLENLRFHKGEKEGNAEFAAELAKNGDVYINDAFGTAHRAHASTAVIAEQFQDDKMLGLLIEKEIKSVGEVLENDKKPVTAILGGAKVSGKISIIHNLLDKVDNLIIGGGMTYTFIKAQGGQTGKSLVEEDYLDVALEALKKAEDKGVRVMLPEDSVVADAFDNDANQKTVPSDNIPEGWMGLDIGPDAIARYKSCIEESSTILWNGPMGVFEMSNFENGTREIAYAIVAAAERGAFSLVGGGDSVAAINKYNLAEHVNHVSTGGGAMLEYLEGKELPGLKVIEG